MKQTILIIAAALALSACGGGGGAEAPPAGDLNPAFGGTWTGNTVVTVPTFPSTTMPGTLDVVVSGRSATITRLCPDGSGSVVATGGGDTASWSGTLVCQPIPVGACPSVTATLTSATGTLGAGGTKLTVNGVGTVSGCAASLGATLVFTGAK